MGVRASARSRPRERNSRMLETRHPMRAAIAFAMAIEALSLGRAYADTVHVVADTNINLATPGQINGSGTTLLVRNSGAGGERHTFLRFDLSTLPVGVPVSQAKL